MAMRTIVQKEGVYIHIGDLTRVLNRSARKHPQTPHARTLKTLTDQLVRARRVALRLAAEQERRAA